MTLSKRGVAGLRSGASGSEYAERRADERGEGSRVRRVGSGAVKVRPQDLRLRPQSVVTPLHNAGQGGRRVCGNSAGAWSLRSLQAPARGSGRGRLGRRGDVGGTPSRCGLVPATLTGEQSALSRAHMGASESPAPARGPGPLPAHEAEAGLGPEGKTVRGSRQPSCQGPGRNDELMETNTNKFKQKEMRKRGTSP